MWVDLEVKVLMSWAFAKNWVQTGSVVPHFRCWRWTDGQSFFFLLSDLEKELRTITVPWFAESTLCRLELQDARLSLLYCSRQGWMSVRLLQSVFCLQGETWHWCRLCTGLHTFGSAVWNGRKHNGRSSQNRSDSDSGQVSCWFHFHLEVEDFFNGLELLSQIFSAITAKKYVFVVLLCSFFTSKLHCLKVVFIHQMATICGLTCGLLELWRYPP